MYKCGKCTKIISKKQSCILCESCNKWIHKKCSLLGNQDFEIASKNNEPWFCWDCIKNNIPFATLEPKKIANLFEIPKKASKNVEISGIPWCKQCNKKIIMQKVVLNVLNVPI